ncbi:hypothetical protein NZD89_08910 [Alicyclobacillus fastidiosus]|uniref:Uncharacterized protein n=1 Tax=Alicyclobacillus fastidiosus TaxID=392011 RepID=A0ABY6ZKU4_9BACL|nr:hypothetical protein [Alicyclobacillus fastidiosus]WAH43482.1 hypothetical protein NZD89_08910 [Alicyclobacillus fastidiosus]
MKGQPNDPTANLKKGKSIQFIFDAPIKEVFGDSKLLDFNEPEFELDGYTKEGNKEIPFGMSGDVGLFLSEHK